MSAKKKTAKKSATKRAPRKSATQDDAQTAERGTSVGGFGYKRHSPTKVRASRG